MDSILDKKGSDILVLDIREQSILTDYFLIASGDNDRQIRALANAVIEDSKKKGGLTDYKMEGQPEGGWVLVDLGDVIVHLFSPEKRNFYQLEELWHQAHVVLRMQ